MSSSARPAPRAFRRGIVKVHRWLSIGAAAFWMVQAVTGILLSFHFELEDIALTTAHKPTDLAAVEQRLNAFASAAPDAKVHWIWTTAGLPDRYVVLFDDGSGVTRKAYIDGGGLVLRDRAATDYSFLGLMREIHLTLLSGKTGHWILAVTGVLLVSNLFIGLVAAWPRRGMWKAALVPAKKLPGAGRLYSWHRAVGLWAVIPALVIVGTGTLILFEHEIGDLIGAEDIVLPSNPPEGPGVGFAEAAQAAVAAIEGSRFVGTTLPTPEDASYYAWVRAPGELYRGGYGGSLVIVDANHGSVRGAWPATETGAAKAFIGSFYPLHTGEAAGLVGRILALAIGVWLAAMLVLGLLLWLRRRHLRKPSASAKTSAPLTSEA